MSDITTPEAADSWGGGATPAGGSPSAGGDRLAEIRGMMTADPARYWSADVQNEERALIAAGMKGGDNVVAFRQPAAEGAYLPADEARSSLDQTLVADWDREPGGFNAHYQRATETTDAIFAGLTEYDRGGVQASFDALPGTVQASIQRELGMGLPFIGDPASYEEIHQFRELVGSADEMLADWGPMAGHYVAVFGARLGRLAENMSPRDSAAFTAWANRLSPETWRKIVNAMVA